MEEVNCAVQSPFELELETSGGGRRRHSIDGSSINSSSASGSNPNKSSDNDNIDNDNDNEPPLCNTTIMIGEEEDEEEEGEVDGDVDKAFIGEDGEEVDEESAAEEAKVDEEKAVNDNARNNGILIVSDENDNKTSPPPPLPLSPPPHDDDDDDNVMNDGRTSSLVFAANKTTTTIIGVTAAATTAAVGRRRKNKGGEEADQEASSEAGGMQTMGSNADRLDPIQRQWLENLKRTAELETMTILYAKSVLQLPKRRSSTFVGEQQQKQWQQQQQRVGTTRVPIGDFGRPQSSQMSPLLMSQSVPQPLSRSAHTNFSTTFDASASTESSHQGLRLRVTRVDVSEQGSKANSNHDGSRLHRSTVCLLPSPTPAASNEGETKDHPQDASGQLAMSRSLVMNQHNRVTVVAASRRPMLAATNETPNGTGTTNGNGEWGSWRDQQQQTTLTKFARSLPNGRSLCERLAESTETEEEAEEEDVGGTTTEHEMGNGMSAEWNKGGDRNAISNGMLINVENPPPSSTRKQQIYQPNIRYRQKGQNSRQRRDGLRGAFGLSLCHPSDLQSLVIRPVGFRHSIRVNNEPPPPPSPQQQQQQQQQEKAASNGQANGDMLELHQQNGRLHDQSFHHRPPSAANSSSVGAFSPRQQHSQSKHLLTPFYQSHQPSYNGCAEVSSSDSGQGSSGGSPPYGGYSTILPAPSSRRRDAQTSMASDLAFSSSSLELRMPMLESRRQQAMADCNANSSSLSLPLPSYARTANTIDQMLRLSSAVFTHLSSSPSSSSSSSSTKKLIESTRTLIRLLESCPCAQQMPHSAIELVHCAILDAEQQANDVQKKMEANEAEEASAVEHHEHNNNDYLAVCVRQMLEGCMLVFVRVICQYLGQCAGHDRLLLISLEQLVHLLLFGEELCVEAIRLRAIDNLLALCPQQPQLLTAGDTLKLRALAVLCGSAKGCLHLLAVGGLDFILRVLCSNNDNNGHRVNANNNRADANANNNHRANADAAGTKSSSSQPSFLLDCSFEAAGCLAQLCSPAHCFVRPDGAVLVPTLLRLVDAAQSAEQLLLCLAALTNLSVQSAGPVCELLYVNNAVLRLIRAAQRPPCADNVFAQEQLVTILTRLANRGHERALLAQGAVPTLCKLLLPPGTTTTTTASSTTTASASCKKTITSNSSNKNSSRHADLQKRISYKAAVCLGCLASTGFGLNELHKQGVHPVLMAVLRPENRQRSMTPLQLICSSIRQKLESTYPQMETVV